MVKTKKIGVIGAHAMDAELMGGSIALQMKKQGWESFYIHITRGERGNPNKSPDVFGKQLEEEMDNCAQALGGQSIWAGFKAGDVPFDACADYIAGIIKELRLDAIITHWRGSFHPRHRIVHDCVLEGVSRSAKLGCAIKSLYFGENMEDLDGYIPNVYMDISTVYASWFTALKCYELFRESSNGFPYQSFYTSNSRIRGLESGCSYAKSLMMQRSLISELSFPVTPIIERE